MKERKEVNHTLRLPENITIRTNKGEDIVNEVQVWEDEDVSVLTGATKKKTMRVLRDLGNRGNGAGGTLLFLKCFFLCFYLLCSDVNLIV